jgi:hypothetical protein
MMVVSITNYISHTVPLTTVMQVVLEFLHSRTVLMVGLSYHEEIIIFSLSLAA